MTRLVLAALVLAAGTAPAEADKPRLDMTAFFMGRSHAENVLRIALQGPKSLVVDSVGGRNKEGEFVLVDTVHEQGKPVRTRTWVMHPAGPGRFTGFLSDAAGPVDVVVSGDTATIQYVMKDGGLRIVQRVRLENDGKTLANHVVARKFGLAFAHVDGTIRKLD